MILVYRRKLQIVLIKKTYLNPSVRTYDLWLDLSSLYMEQLLTFFLKLRTTTTLYGTIIVRIDYRL